MIQNFSTEPMLLLVNFDDSFMMFQVSFGISMFFIGLAVLNLGKKDLLLSNKNLNSNI